jgi:hypothetical protein
MSLLIRIFPGSGARLAGEAEAMGVAAADCDGKEEDAALCVEEVARVGGVSD